MQSRFLGILFIFILLTIIVFPSKQWASDISSSHKISSSEKEMIEKHVPFSFLLPAYIATMNRQYKVAAEFYEKALSSMPNSKVNVRYMLMINLIMSNEFQEAIKHAEKLLGEEIQYFPIYAIIAKYFPIYAIVAMDSVNRGDYQKAQDIFSQNIFLKSMVVGQNIESHGSEFIGRILMAWIGMGRKDIQGILGSIPYTQEDKLLNILRNYELGMIAGSSGNMQIARSYLNRAIFESKSIPIVEDIFKKSIIALARLESEDGNAKGALKLLSFGIELLEDCESFEILRNTIERGEKISFQKLTPVQGMSSVFLSLSMIGFREQRHELVELFLKIAYMFDPESDHVLFALARFSEFYGETEQAIKFYQKIPGSSLIKVDSLRRLSFNLIKQKRVNEGKKYMQSLIDSYPDNIRNYLAYGALLYGVQDYVGMIENYDKAIEIMKSKKDTSYWSLFFSRGVAQKSLHKWFEAESDFLRALELYPDHPHILNNLAYLWVDMNIHLKKASNILCNAVRIRPNDSRIVQSLGWAYFRLGRFQDAVNILEKASMLSPNDSDINDHLGDAYWRIGRTLEASYQWDHAIAFCVDKDKIVQIQRKKKEGLPPLGDKDTKSLSGGSGVSEDEDFVGCIQ
ncbi:tetratricopeptide repeat protein [Candidatus Liberibacter sp.]|uniref:tetratricopeptide repeat protein n=1 Tax=Candidatus Liberibacter sp. TaxID=34022 RepID=UPI0015F4AED9|nr:tetratricopeptide repeat protein [Candidatus Liberibacter sp.]MBA5723908.1 tetratricopeptide repeat protein [Candidatus Liberibacter sp.]